MMKKYYIRPEQTVYAVTPNCIMRGSVKVDQNGALSDDGTIDDANNALGRKFDLWKDEEEDDEYQF